MQRQLLIEGHLLQVHDFDVIIVSLDRAREQDVLDQRLAPATQIVERNTVPLNRT
jgi:hypothetical protein